MMKPTARSLPSGKGKITLAAWNFLSTVKDITYEEEYASQNTTSLSKNSF